MTIKTHISVTDSTIKDRGRGFKLSPLNPQSANIIVSKHPRSVIVWDLAFGEIVTVRRARVDSLGNTRWAVDESACCPNPVPPSDNANVNSMPYKRCGVEVVLTHDNPQALIDDAGVYYFVYEGDGDIVIDHFDDPIVRKCCC